MAMTAAAADLQCRRTSNALLYPAPIHASPLPNIPPIPPPPPPPSLPSYIVLVNEAVAAASQITPRRACTSSEQPSRRRLAEGCHDPGEYSLKAAGSSQLQAEFLLELFGPYSLLFGAPLLPLLLPLPLPLPLP
ncbi:hypothetical protein B0H13DRAFT_2370974 [Mycena leptocephala]|nr:hypothetical protein B0H13DRAFT_2370974 [Mycena leptocephala]